MISTEEMTHDFHRGLGLGRPRGSTREDGERESELLLYLRVRRLCFDGVRFLAACDALVTLSVLLSAALRLVVEAGTLGDAG